MTDLLEFRAVGKLAEYIGHALVRVREGRGFNQKQLRGAVNSWRVAQYGERVKKVGSGTLSDAENGVSNFEIGTIEDALASIRATPMELIYQAFVVATYEQKGDPLPPIKRRRRGQPHEGQDAAPLNTAHPRSAGTFPVTENASDESADSAALVLSETSAMQNRSDAQRSLIEFATSIRNDADADALYNAMLRELNARRSIQAGAADEGAT
jgi:hypothetical protein